MFKKYDPVFLNVTPYDFWIWLQLNLSADRFSSTDGAIFKLRHPPTFTGEQYDTRVEIAIPCDYCMPPGLVPPPSYTGPAAQVTYFDNEILPKMEKVVITFSFEKVESGRYKIISTVDGPKSVFNYYENDLFLKIGMKWPKQANPQPLEISTEQLDQQTQYRKILDELCILWANRGCLPGYNMDEFLQQEATSLNYISKKEFKRALQDAYKRNIISKNKRRYCPKTCP